MFRQLSSSEYFRYLLLLIVFNLSANEKDVYCSMYLREIVLKKQLKKSCANLFELECRVTYAETWLSEGC